MFLVSIIGSKLSGFQGSSKPSLQSPPTVSSSPSSSSGSNSTTPTNDLGERGSPAGASNGFVNKGQSRKHLEPHGNIKTLFSPQPSRRSPPQFVTRLPENRSDPRLFKPTKLPTFTRRHTVSVADRIAQFGGPKHMIPIHRTFSHVNDDKGPSCGGIGGLDPYKDIEEDNKSPPSTTDKKESESNEKKNTVDDASLETKETKVPRVADNTQQSPSSSLQPSEGTHNDNGSVTPSLPFSQSSDQLTPSISSYTLTQPDRYNDLVSPTSSIEELSFINQKRDAAKSHDHINPPNTQQSYQQRSIQSHHSVGYPNHTSHHPSLSGTTYLPRPPQPLANTSNSLHPLYATYSTNTNQPLGIATANMALAHNAAAKGDVTTLVCMCMHGCG